MTTDISKFADMVNSFANELISGKAPKVKKQKISKTSYEYAVIKFFEWFEEKKEGIRSHKNKCEYTMLEDLSDLFIENSDSLDSIEFLDRIKNDYFSGNLKMEYEVEYGINVVITFSW